ncbi:Hypothetical protein NTJ_03757 [Nesidiocoris tenuis]|uniref:Uncharacterized protein n=2 Tax=Nesidiocoris tenuis TaxID=355587 RepID=A0ABN7AHU6_9HEMI|nr:Hypothetical protein NTJ_03757 [Nesidiocoris tenuis]
MMRENVDRRATSRTTRGTGAAGAGLVLEGGGPGTGLLYRDRAERWTAVRNLLPVRSAIWNRREQVPSYAPLVPGLTRAAEVVAVAVATRDG